MHIWRRLLWLALLSLALAATFWGGFELGRERTAAVAASRVSVLKRERDTAAGQVADLDDRLTSARQDGVALERDRQIERETNRSLQEELKKAQDERLDLLKENTYLKRLVQEGGARGLRVHDMTLVPGDAPRTFTFAFTVTQLVSGAGVSTGQVRLRIDGTRDGKKASLELPPMPMRFEHFQGFHGSIELSEGLEPQTLTVTLAPEVEGQTTDSASFPWAPASPLAIGPGTLTLPASGLTSPSKTEPDRGSKTP